MSHGQDSFIYSGYILYKLYKNMVRDFDHGSHMLQLSIWQLCSNTPHRNYTMPGYASRRETLSVLAEKVADGARNSGGLELMSSGFPG